MPNAEQVRSSQQNVDSAFVDRIDAVQSILKVLARSTGMRIALVAEVTSDSWTARAVLDEAGFGLQPGDQLELQSTY
jgi:hypothetical protein